jgi:hypothetical protein
VTGTPGLDPARVEAAADGIRLFAQTPWVRTAAERILVADDACARDAGLICAGDGLTREALDGLVAVARHAMEYADHAQVRGWAQMALRTLPSSLLDGTPEGAGDE